MVTPVARLRQNYAAAFTRYLIHRDEAAREAAYELGRSSLEDGVRQTNDSDRDLIRRGLLKADAA